MRASGAGADAVASFYRAAAVALSEARAPGDVLDTLTLVRGVALRDDEDDASRGASRRAGEASPSPLEGSLAALAAAARRTDPAFAWSGFEYPAVLGGFVFGALVGATLFVPIRYLVIAYRRWAHEKVSKNKFFKWLTNFWLIKILKWVFVGGTP